MAFLVVRYLPANKRKQPVAVSLGLMPTVSKKRIWYCSAANAGLVSLGGTDLTEKDLFPYYQKLVQFLSLNRAIKSCLSRPMQLHSPYLLSCFPFRCWQHSAVRGQGKPISLPSYVCRYNPAAVGGQPGRCWCLKLPRCLYLLSVAGVTVPCNLENETRC